jgi:hypothetical protein
MMREEAGPDGKEKLTEADLSPSTATTEPIVRLSTDTSTLSRHSNVPMTRRTKYAVDTLGLTMIEVVVCPPVQEIPVSDKALVRSLALSPSTITVSDERIFTPPNLT